MWNFPQILDQARNDLASADDASSLEACRLKYFGKKGLVPAIFDSLFSALPEHKPAIGKGANDLRVLVIALLEEKARVLGKREGGKSSGRPVDFTMPGVGPVLGHRHILTQTMTQICDVFERMGF